MFMCIYIYMCVCVYIHPISHIAPKMEWLQFQGLQIASFKRRFVIWWPWNALKWGDLSHPSLAFCRAGFSKSVWVRRIRSSNSSCCWRHARSTWCWQYGLASRVSLGINHQPPRVYWPSLLGRHRLNPQNHLRRSAFFGLVSSGSPSSSSVSDPWKASSTSWTQLISLGDSTLAAQGWETNGRK